MGLNILNFNNNKIYNTLSKNNYTKFTNGHILPLTIYEIFLVSFFLFLTYFFRGYNLSCLYNHKTGYWNQLSNSMSKTETDLGNGSEPSNTEPRVNILSGRATRLGFSDPSDITGHGEVELGGYRLQPLIILVLLQQTNRSLVSFKWRISKSINL